MQTHCQWNTRIIHKQSHLYDWQRPMFLACSVFSGDHFLLINLFIRSVIIFFYLEKEVCAVIVENLCIPLHDGFAVFIELRLYKVIFFGKDAQGTRHIVIFKVRNLQQILSLYTGGQF